MTAFRREIKIQEVGGGGDLCSVAGKGGSITIFSRFAADVARQISSSPDPLR